MCSMNLNLTELNKMYFQVNMIRIGLFWNNLCTLGIDRIHFMVVLYSELSSFTNMKYTNNIFSFHFVSMEVTEVHFEK